MGGITDMAVIGIAAGVATFITGLPFVLVINFIYDKRADDRDRADELEEAVYDAETRAMEHESREDERAIERELREYERFELEMETNKRRRHRTR